MLIKIGGLGGRMLEINNVSIKLQTKESIRIMPAKELIADRVEILPEE
jgi:hypothetical protein